MFSKSIWNETPGQGIASDSIAYIPDLADHGVGLHNFEVWPEVAVGVMRSWPVQRTPSRRRTFCTIHRLPPVSRAGHFERSIHSRLHVFYDYRIFEFQHNSRYIKYYISSNIYEDWNSIFAIYYHADNHMRSRCTAYYRCGGVSFTSGQIDALSF